MLGSIRFPLTSFGIATAVALLSASSPSAQGDEEEEFDRTPRRCVATARIRNTDILDDRTIIFYLRGNKDVFRTYLPRECPGLERNDRFSYQTHNGQLCDSDTITVLEQIGTRLSPSFTCRLGEFIPITAEEAEDLKLENEGATHKRNSIQSERAELPPENAEAQDAPAADAATDDGGPPAPPPEKPSRREQRRGSGITSR
jgi:hypothetical protein